METRPRDVAHDLARLIRGEIDVRDFPWLDEQERLALGALGMSMLKAAKPEVARAAFGVLIDLEPHKSVHHLMRGHAAALSEHLEEAFDNFGQAIALAVRDDNNAEVASEALLARGELLLRLGRSVEARADFAAALARLDDPVRRRALEAYLAS